MFALDKNVLFKLDYISLSHKRKVQLLYELNKNWCDQDNLLQILISKVYMPGS